MNEVKYLPMKCEGYSYPSLWHKHELKRCITGYTCFFFCTAVSPRLRYLQSILLYSRHHQRTNVVDCKRTPKRHKALSSYVLVTGQALVVQLTKTSAKLVFHSTVRYANVACPVSYWPAREACCPFVISDTRDVRTPHRLMATTTEPRRQSWVSERGKLEIACVILYRLWTLHDLPSLSGLGSRDIWHLVVCCWDGPVVAQTPATWPSFDGMIRCLFAAEKKKERKTKTERKKK